MPYYNQTFVKWLSDNIYKNTDIDSSIPTNNVALVKPCTKATDTKFRYCLKPYSKLTLRQELDVFLKNAYEKRLQINAQYNCTYQNMTNVPQSVLKEFSEYFFYIQSVRGGIKNMSNT